MLTADVDQLRSACGGRGAAVFAFPPCGVELEVMFKKCLELRESQPQENLRIQSIGIKD